MHEDVSAMAPGLPSAQGLYDPAHEHDACGVGFVAHIKGRKSHDIVEKGVERGPSKGEVVGRYRPQSNDETTERFHCFYGTLPCFFQVTLV